LHIAHPLQWPLLRACTARPEMTFFRHLRSNCCWFGSRLSAYVWPSTLLYYETHYAKKPSAAVELIAILSLIKGLKPFDRDSRFFGMQYIGILKNCGLKQRLKTARQNMQTIFPLPEYLWLDWLREESSSGKTDDELEELLELFETATEDFFSVNIWELYLQ
jgi:hypothetical protein